MKKSEGWGILGAIGLLFIVAGFLIDSIRATIPLSMICTCVCLYYQIKIDKEETEGIQELN